MDRVESVEVYGVGYVEAAKANGSVVRVVTELYRLGYTEAAEAYASLRRVEYTEATKAAGSVAMFMVGGAGYMVGFTGLG